MQFTTLFVAAFAAVASAQYTYSNGTTSAVAPSGTGSPSASSTPSETVPFEGAAPLATGAGSAMAVLIAAGGAALLIRFSVTNITKML
ncbi:hypothetical protein N0V90_003296 [Kalmusia sp. IMI 367209]|nr:hypothetical protein N0V90_003296 [Kalmusia sp. IMI 367209]